MPDSENSQETKMFNLVRYYRKKYNKRYPDRFIQGIDYEEIYHPRYKYEMIQDRSVGTSLRGYRVTHRYFDLLPTGLMFIREGYRSDGPSGLTVDTPSFMGGAFSHDVKFQMLRMGLLPIGDWEENFQLSNKDLRTDCLLDGMTREVAFLVEWFVNNYGHKYATSKVG